MTTVGYSARIQVSQSLFFCAGLDLGVFLVRNSAWSRRFLDVLAHEARSQPAARVRRKPLRFSF